MCASCELACTHTRGISEPGVLDVVLCLLLQGADLGSLGGHALGVEPLQRGEEAQAVAGAHGLLQVAGLVQQLLDGLVALQRAALHHLERGSNGIRSVTEGLGRKQPL